MKATALLLAVVAGCHPAPYRSAPPVRVDVPWPVRQPVHKKEHETDMAEGGNPIEVIRGAADTKDQAKNYVLAPNSEPDSIDQLTILSQKLDVARNIMEEHRKKDGRYDQRDVAALARATKAMRDFISQVNGH